MLANTNTHSEHSEHTPTIVSWWWWGFRAAQRVASATREQCAMPDTYLNSCSSCRQHNSSKHAQITQPPPLRACFAFCAAQRNCKLLVCVRVCVVCLRVRIRVWHCQHTHTRGKAKVYEKGRAYNIFRIQLQLLANNSHRTKHVYDYDYDYSLRPGSAVWWRCFRVACLMRVQVKLTPKCNAHTNTTVVTLLVLDVLFAHACASSACSFRINKTVRAHSRSSSSSDTRSCSTAAAAAAAAITQQPNRMRFDCGAHAQTS